MKFVVSLDLLINEMSQKLLALSSLPALASSTGVGLWRLSSSVCQIEVISLTYTKARLNLKKMAQKQKTNTKT